MDYAPWGLLALAAIVFGGVSILAVPPLGLVGLGVLAYLVYQHLTGTEGPGDDPDRR